MLKLSLLHYLKHCCHVKFIPNPSTTPHKCLALGPEHPIAPNPSPPCRFEETSQLSGICSEEEAQAGKCYGGFARMATLVREARRAATPDRPVFFLNAGDTYQGTKLFSHYKWRIVTKFLNILRPDVVVSYFGRRPGRPVKNR